MHPVKSIEWSGKAARILDQTLLPGRTKYLLIRDDKAMWEAIRKLRIRGAPAIGVAAAYGLYLGVAARKPRTLGEFRRHVAAVAKYLATSRPTAVNLFWALDRCTRFVAGLASSTDAKTALAQLLDLAHTICREDEETCDAMGRHGAPLLAGAKGVVTHCNTGALATAGLGTALAVIYHAHRANPGLMVYADETRPLLQGARLTAWELTQGGVDFRLITDGMAGSVLQRGLAQAVITGADRIAANGDAANKIGTQHLAIVAKHYRVPFYIAAPLSTFDCSIASGEQIPIEERGDEEIVAFGGARVAPTGTRTFNPAFDVTPAALIAGIVTEVGVLRPPYKRSIAQAFAVAWKKR